MRPNEIAKGERRSEISLCRVESGSTLKRELAWREVDKIF